MRRPVGRRRGVVGARLGEESGSILVVSAVLIPVMLVLVAFVVDVGTWYTHKRQLQNRADAGALAAGVDFAANWAGCVQDEDPALKAATEAVIMASARTYAGDPTSAAPVNTEIAHQARVEVLLNSTTYTTGSDGSDGGGPCFDHAGDAISPGGGEWLDVKVVERDLP